MTTTPTDYTVTAAGQMVLDQIAYILDFAKRMAERARTAEEDADRLAKALAFHPLNDQICDEALDAHAVAKAKR